MRQNLFLNEGRIRFDWTYRLELTDEGETNEELDSSQDQTDFVSLLVCLFISVAEKDKYSTVETMSTLRPTVLRAVPSFCVAWLICQFFSLLSRLLAGIMEHLRKNFAQVMCKNSVKIRKAVGTALNKILRNFSALDQVPLTLHCINLVSCLCTEGTKQVSKIFILSSPFRSRRC